MYTKRKQIIENALLFHKYQREKKRRKKNQYLARGEVFCIIVTVVSKTCRLM